MSRNDGLFTPIELTGSNYILRVGQGDWKIVISRLYYSVVYRGLCVSLVLLSALEFLIIVLGAYSVWWSRGIQLVLVLMVILGFLVRVAVRGYSVFLVETKSILDTLRTLTAVFLLVISLLLPETVGKFIAGMGVLVIVLHTALDLYYLHLTLKAITHTDMNIFDLNEMSDMDDKKITRQPDKKNTGILPEDSE